MRSNIEIPEYEEGVAQSILFRTFTNGRRYAVPRFNFLDEWTQREWARCFATCARANGYGRTNTSAYLADIMRHRSNEKRIAMIEIRKRGQRALGDKFSREGGLFNRIRNQPLVPQTFRYDRAIGVELECCRPNGREVALPLWSRESGDGSIRSFPNTQPVEYKLLLKRSELELRLHRFCTLISDHRVNTSCGLHVHLDCRGRLETDVRAVAKRMTAWLIALREFVPESRRNNSDYAALSFSETNRYRAVNFTAFHKYKTLEIRLHSGTVDYTKIIAWIRLVELLFVMTGKPKAGAQGVAALSQLPLTEYERSYWLKRHAQLNPGQYSSTTPNTENE